MHWWESLIFVVIVLLITVCPSSRGLSPALQTPLGTLLHYHQTTAVFTTRNHNDVPKDNILLENSDIILEQIYQDHENSIGQYQDLNEERKKRFREQRKLPSFKWIRNRNSNHDNNQKVAALTLDPILNQTMAHLLRESMTEYWKQYNPNATSRYTYPGNQEAHLEAIYRSGVWNETVRQSINCILNTKLFPLVRLLFGQELRLEEEDDGSLLCLYDSLFVRYDPNRVTQKTKSKKEESINKAGLPLHRDLGLVSINIMLSDDFKGGGTFFEGLLNESCPPPVPGTDAGPILFPKGVGYALLHRSNQRHAGIPTTAGIRDIWTLFVTTQRIRPPDISTRLKMMAEASSVEQREVYLKLALKQCPDDGELWHDLGMTLHSLQKTNMAPDVVVEYLQYAQSLSPKDARIYNNIGTVLEQRQIPGKSNATLSLQAFEQCLRLYKMYLYYSCPNVQYSFETSAWNYAHVLMNRNLWEAAWNVLQIIQEDDELRVEAEQLSKICQANLEKLAS